MAAKYSPHQIIQLLQVSVWRCNATMDYTGFSILSEAIIGHNSSNNKKEYPDIEQKYLNQLLLDAEKAIETKTKVGRNEQYIKAILAYNDCSNWKEFQEEVARVERFLDFTKVDFSKSKKEGVTIIYDDSARSSLSAAISALKNISPLPIEVQVIDSSGDFDVLQKLDESISETPFVVWCVTNEMNDMGNLSNSQELEEHLSSGQFCPIRVSDDLSERHLTTSFSEKKPIGSGLLGLYLSVAIIKQGLEILAKSPSGGSKKTSKDSSHFNVEQNSGTVYQIDKMKGENITLGGNFIQNIHTKKKK